MALDWTDRLFQERKGAIRIRCGGCGVDMFIPPSKVGQRAHCTTECKLSVERNKVLSWELRIWEKREGTIEKPCEGCGSVMHLPKSKVGRRFCRIECRSAFTISELTTDCPTCGKSFIAGSRRQRYCSQRCNPATAKISSAENLLRAQEGRRRAFLEGRAAMPIGENNKQWKGGPKATRDRQIRSGKAAAQLRRYRKANPDKVKEYSQRRKDRKTGRLPRGTVSKLRELQRDKCAICASRLRGAGHLDHIIPLAKGGPHIPSNLQLLCAPCNVSKSDKDPIIYMQSLGRLL